MTLAKLRQIEKMKLSAVDRALGEGPETGLRASYSDLSLLQEVCVRD